MEDVEEKMGNNEHVVVMPIPPLPHDWEAAADPASGKLYFFHCAIGRARWDPPTLQEAEEYRLRIAERVKAIRSRVARSLTASP